MVPEKEGQSGVEWRVTVPEGGSAVVDPRPANGWVHRVRAWSMAAAAKVVAEVAGFGRKAWRIGADDPRRVVHGVKVGAALALVSLFYYTRPLYDGVGGWAMWAVMTVVVVFEFTVGERRFLGASI